MGNYYHLAKRAFSEALEPLFKELQRKVDEVVDSEVNDLRAVAAAQGKIPEAANDMPTARDVLVKVKGIGNLLNSAQAVLLELERKGN